MSEIVILGSGSGLATKNRFCTSTALLVNRSVYLLDCGEPCSALLFRNGIDPFALRALFISHMHTDHTSGLPQLLASVSMARRSSRREFKPWSISRNDPWYREALWFPPSEGTERDVPGEEAEVTVVLPSEGVAAVSDYLEALYLSPSVLPYDLTLQPIREGLTYDDGQARVAAVANAHLTVNFMHDGLLARGPKVKLQSYSFGVQVDHTKLVFSGDIDHLEELNPLLDNADVLVVEVAHYDPEGIGPFVKDLALERVILTHIHPGLEQRLSGLVERWADPRIQIARDGLRVRLT